MSILKFNNLHEVHIFSGFISLGLHHNFTPPPFFEGLRILDRGGWSSTMFKMDHYDILETLVFLKRTFEPRRHKPVYPRQTGFSPPSN